MAAKTIECFLMDYPFIDDFTAFLAREAWKAAIKSVEENGSSHNSEGAPCEVAASCPVHRCRECRRYYDDMYQLT